MSSSTVNLPAIVTNVGGDLEKVVRDIEAYTEPHYPLTNKGRVALARFIEVRPDLNKERYVSLVVDALTFHGVDSAPELGRIVDEFSTEIVHQALDYLYEVGRRGRGKEEKGKTDWFGDTGIRAVCQLIFDLESEDYIFDSVDALVEAIYIIGGLDEAVTLTERELAQALNDNESLEMEMKEEERED